MGLRKAVPSTKRIIKVLMHNNYYSNMTTTEKILEKTKVVSTVMIHQSLTALVKLEQIDH